MLTIAQLQSLAAFAEDDRAALDLEAYNQLTELCNRVSRNIAKRVTGLQKRNDMLSDRLERFKDKRDEKRALGEFEETGLDSVEVYRALLYCLQQHTMNINKTRIMYIMYKMYSSWLASKGERLFLEHPVAQEWGPTLWRVSKRINLDKVGHDEWKALTEKNPGVAAFCRNAADKYFDYPLKDLKAFFIKSAPFKKATPEFNGGKWGTQIDDKEIYLWATSNRLTK